MSQNNGDPNKIPIECQVCKQHFSIAKPRLEISNNTFSSVVIGAHEKINRCPNNKCRQAFVLMLGMNPQAQLVWGFTLVDDKFVAEHTGSSIVEPALSLIH